MTKTPTPFPPDTFDRMSRDDRWLGHGYLGERRTMLTPSDDIEWNAWADLPERQRIVADTDRRLLALAAEQGWTWEELFTWANSTYGRHFADCAFPGAFDKAVGRWGLFRKVEP